jgi:hypothetical protein
MPRAVRSEIPFGRVLILSAATVDTHKAHRKYNRMKPLTVARIEEGVLILSDKSAWFSHPEGSAKLMSWSPNDRIEIEVGGVSYKRITNLDRNQIVRALKI